MDIRELKRVKFLINSMEGVEDAIETLKIKGYDLSIFMSDEESDDCINVSENLNSQDLYDIKQVILRSLNKKLEGYKVEFEELE